MLRRLPQARRHGRAGKFTIASLDPDLLFRILIAGGGWQPQFVSKVDPALKPLIVTLKPQLGGETPDEKLPGRVADADGKPMADAVINIRGVTRGNGTQFGGNDDMDPVAVSDADGNFISPAPIHLTRLAWTWRRADWPRAFSKTSRLVARFTP